jgi:hypothetical protein
MEAVSTVAIDIGSETLGPLDMEACCQAQWLMALQCHSHVSLWATSNKHTSINSRTRSLIRPVAKQMKNRQIFVHED